MTLAALLIVQLADTQSLRREIQSHWDKVMSAAPLAAPVWRTLGKDHRHLVVVPPWQCGPGRDNGFWVFPMLAVRQGMTINSYYAGRYAPRQIAYFCSEHERIRKEGMRSDTAYVLSDEAYDALIAGGFAPTHDCRKVDGFWLEITDREWVKKRPWLCLAPQQPVQRGLSVPTLGAADTGVPVNLDYSSAEVSGHRSSLRR